MNDKRGTLTKLSLVFITWLNREKKKKHKKTQLWKKTTTEKINIKETNFLRVSSTTLSETVEASLEGFDVSLNTLRLEEILDSIVRTTIRILWDAELFDIFDFDDGDSEDYITFKGGNIERGKLSCF